MRVEVSVKINFERYGQYHMAKFLEFKNPKIHEGLPSYEKREIRQSRFSRPSSTVYSEKINFTLHKFFGVCVILKNWENINYLIDKNVKMIPSGGWSITLVWMVLIAIRFLSWLYNPWLNRSFALHDDDSRK